MLPKKIIRFYRLYFKPILEMLLVGIGLIFTVVFGFVFVFGLMALIMAVDAFVLMQLWPFVIPAILPGLVANGMIAKSVEFSTMFWFIAVLLVLRPVNISNLFPKTNKKEKKDDNK